jgi:hypothetical protein
MFIKFKNIFIINLSLLSLLFVGCLSMQYYNDLKIDSSNIKSKIHKVIIVPPYIPEEIRKVNEAIPKTYEDLVISALKKANIESIPSEEYAKIWEPIEKKSGGFFDPKTGQLDEKKMTESRKQAMNLVNTKFTADGSVYIFFTIANAIFDKSEASWDGVMEISTGYNTKLLYPNAHGRMPALSLLISMKDLDENIIYRNAGGIHLLKYIHPTGSYFVDVPIDQLFIDNSKNERAVNAAMKPFLELYGIIVEPITPPTTGTDYQNKSY